MIRGRACVVALGITTDGVKIPLGLKTGRHGAVVEPRPLPSGAAASLREGMAETLTVTRLGVKGGVKGTLRQILTSTNLCESVIECVRRTSRNVRHWQDGEMCLRWTAAGMLEPEQQFRRVIGHADLAQLATAVEREVTLPQPCSTPTEEAAIVAAA